MAAENSATPRLGLAKHVPEELVEPEGEDEEGYKHTVEELDIDSEMYKGINIDFESAGMIVTKIERIKNTRLLRRFIAERSMLQDERKADQGFKLNERYLYHGTNASKEDLYEEGLDSRMSKEGCFGRGIYFSDYPKKCVKYARQAGNTDTYIFLMRVILGTPKEYEKGKKDKMLKREPQKEPPYTGWRYYDSVKGCPVNHNEYVIYQNQRAIIECIISYSEQGANTQPPVSLDDVTPSIPDSLGSVDSMPSLGPTPSIPSVCDEYSDTSDESDDECNKDDQDDKGKKAGTDGSDSEASSEDEDEDKMTLEDKKKAFSRRTGVAEEHRVDSYLTRTGLELTRAVFLFQAEEQERVEKEEAEKNGGKPKEEEEEEPDPEGTKYFQKDTPLMETDAWNALGEEEQKKIITDYVAKFLSVTALEQENESIAHDILNQSKMDLDQAIVSYYESF